MADNPNKIPWNPVHAWLRVVLWPLPTGFAWMSAYAIIWFVRALSYSPSSPLILIIWIILNCVFTVGTGCFNIVLSPDGFKDGKLRINRVVEFFLIQCLVVVCLPIVTIIVFSSLYPNLF